MVCAVTGKNMAEHAMVNLRQDANERRNGTIIGHNVYQSKQHTEKANIIPLWSL